MIDKVVTIPEVSASEYTNTSRLMHSGPCIVRAVHVGACGANGYCRVYDGLNTEGKLKAYMPVLDGTSYNWLPGDGTDFDYGIYIVVSAVTDHVTVTYIPESRKAFI